MADHEHESMTLAEAIAYLRPDPAAKGTISLQAPRAREAVKVIEAALLQAQRLPGPVPGYMCPPGPEYTLYGATIENRVITVPGCWLPPGHPLLSDGVADV